MRLLLVGLVGVLLAIPEPVVRADTPVAAPRSIEDLVADLSDPVFAVREKAQRELWQRGEKAIPALETAATGSNPEAARRARAVLDTFGWGIYPDTPPAVLKLIRQYQQGGGRAEQNDEVRKQAIADLLKMGRPGVAVVRAILKKDLSTEARLQLTRSVTAIIRHEVPLLLMAGKFAEADELVSLHAVGTTPEGAADFAAYHAIRGDLLVVIRQCETAPKNPRRLTDSKLVLTHLYRASGQWAKARETAADLPPRGDREPTYREVLLEDEGNWGALVDQGPSGERNHPDAVELTLLRLAGRKEKFDEIADQVRDDAREFSGTEAVMDAAVALLSAHRANDATELLLKKKVNLALLSEILISRMRYKEAMGLIGEEKPKDPIPPFERLNFDMRRARVLALTGQADEATKLFEEVARSISTGMRPDRPGGGVREVVADGQTIRTLVRTELRVGLRDLACEHAGLFAEPYAQGRYGRATGETPFELIFPNEPVVAETIFTVYRANKVPGEQPGPTMLRVRDLLNGTAGNAAVDQALKLLGDSAAVLPIDGGATNNPQTSSPRLLKARRFLAIATVCRIAKRVDDAEKAYKTAAELTLNTEDAATATGARSWVYGAPDPARPWIDWGEFLMDANRFKEAAEVFETGWKQFPDQPLPLYLSGFALVKAGNTKEGERRMELAHWVALGNEKVRGRFLDELVRRGEAKAIKRETELILKACWSRDHHFGNVMNQCARGAVLSNDFELAEVCGQRSLLVVLRRPGVYFVDTGAYLNVPYSLLVYRARAELEAGRPENAMVFAREVLAIMPAYFELVNSMVPELESRGLQKEADELFKLSWDAHQKMLKEYPNSHAAQAGLAQLAGRCGRNLDEGLKYAKAAVRADRGSVGYREVLAEVHFRRGERDDAVKLMQALADEQPRNLLYKRQLVRYRTGTFDSPWPHIGGGD